MKNMLIPELGQIKVREEKMQQIRTVINFITLNIIFLI